MARPWSCRSRGRRRPGRVAGLIGVAAGLALALAACIPAQPSSSAAAGGSQPAVLQASHPASAAVGMGPYYPRAALCPLATLAAHDPQACLQ
jgi:hypothetical protein